MILPLVSENVPAILNVYSNDVDVKSNPIAFAIISMQCCSTVCSLKALCHIETLPAKQY